MKIIGSYVNGNYRVTMYSDGTKIRENDLDNLAPAFAENMDVTITRKCSQNCNFCYEGCTPDGKHSDIMHQKWIETLHPFTEIALNGNDLDHPQFDDLLVYLWHKNVFANITVNQNQFMEHRDKINSWYREGLICGLGVSLINPTDEFINEIQKYPNAVIHTINGLLKPTDVEKLSDNNLKILILGYKELQRGKDFKENNSVYVRKNQEWLQKNINRIVNKFNVVSFDNLSLEQLDIKNSGILTEEEWNEFYMGDDGTTTYYIDAVKEEFAKNSISQERFPIMDSVDDMFNFIRGKNNEAN